MLRAPLSSRVLHVDHGGMACFSLNLVIRWLMLLALAKAFVFAKQPL